MSSQILVIAEDPALRLMLERVAHSAGYKSHAVVPEADLSAVTQTFAPDLALIDQHPSDAAALRAAGALKKIHPHLPVIFLGSGEQTIKSAMEALRHHGDDYLQRPLPAQQLIQRMARYLMQQPPQLADPSLVIPGLTHAQLRDPPTLRSPIPVAHLAAGTRPHFASITNVSAPPMGAVSQRPIPAVEPQAPGFHGGVPGVVLPVKALTPSEGQFPEGAMPALLWACIQQRVTGRLDVGTGAEADRSLFLQDGQAIALRSRLKGDRLEEFLQANGFLTPAQATLARSRGILAPRRAAAALAEDGVLKTQEVFDLTRAHLKDRVMALLERGQGSFHFVPDTAPDSERVALDESTQALLWRGIRRKFGQDRLVPLLGGPATLLLPHAQVDLGDFALDDVDLTACRALDGAHTLLDASSSYGLPLERIYQAAFLLLTVGAARMGARGLDASPGSPEARIVDVEIDKGRVLELLRRCQECNYFEMLGVDKDATRTEVEEALRQLKGRVTGQRFEDPALQDVRPALSEITAILEEAQAVLLTEPLRQRYRAALP